MLIAEVLETLLYPVRVRDVVALSRGRTMILYHRVLFRLSFLFARVSQLLPPLVHEHRFPLHDDIKLTSSVPDLHDPITPDRKGLNVVSETCPDPLFQLPHRHLPSLQKAAWVGNCLLESMACTRSRYTTHKNTYRVYTSIPAIFFPRSTFSTTFS